MRHIFLAKWLEDSVGKLVAAGHQVGDIANYSFVQFLAFTKIENRQAAVRRMEFISDLGSVAGGMYAKKGDDPLGEHVDDLDRVFHEGN